MRKRCISRDQDRLLTWPQLARCLPAHDAFALRVGLRASVRASALARVPVFGSARDDASPAL